MTCDQCCQKEYPPSGIGGRAQTSDLLDLLEQHVLQWSVTLLDEVQIQVNDTCCRSGSDGRKQTKRDNSRPIGEGVDPSQIV